jgi:hypothetical protein
MTITNFPRPFCSACRLAFTPIDARICVACQKLALAHQERLTRSIQDYEHKYDLDFVRLDKLVHEECGCKIEGCSCGKSEIKAAKPVVVDTEQSEKDAQESIARGIEAVYRADVDQLK